MWCEGHTQQSTVSRNTFVITISCSVSELRCSFQRALLLLDYTASEYVVQFCWHVHYPMDLLRISHLARLCLCCSLYTNTYRSENVTLPLLFNSHLKSITVSLNSLWDQENCGSIHTKFTSCKVINRTWLDICAPVLQTCRVFASSALPVKAELRQAVKKVLLETCRRIIKLIAHELLKRKAVWCEASDNASFCLSS